MEYSNTRGSFSRLLPRPVNTVVADNGKDGPHRFAVRERSGTKYIQHGNPQPKNGRVIGHIFDGRFVPLHEATASSGPDMLSYGKREKEPRVFSL